MRIGSRELAALGLAALASLALGGDDRRDDERQSFAVITQASVDGEVLVIRGRGFGRRVPAVSLGGVPLTGVRRVSDSEVRATLPAGNEPGTYLLKLSQHGESPFAFFNVTIGAVGPQGPPGPKGEKGDKGDAGPPGPGLETGQISGRLVACTPKDFDGATVYVPGRSFAAITGTGGEFELSYLPPGLYDVVAAQAGHKLLTLPGVPVSPTLDSNLGDVQTTKLDSDPANCGTCGNACPTGHACVAGVCTCAPTTCAAHGWNCGIVSDGCGGTLNCGTCASGFVCGESRANVCGRPDATDPCAFLRQSPDAPRIPFCP